jgi:hypothetical protein
MRTGSLPLLLTLLLAAAPSGAMPKPGERFPAITSTDLHGRPVSTRTWFRGRSLLVVTTDRAGSELARAWIEAARKRGLATPRLHSLVSLRLPFFVSADWARDEARKQVPRNAWAHTVLEVRGQSAQALQLPTSKEPYVFVVDADGRVLASVHGLVDGPRSHAIWEALKPGREAPAEEAR